MAEFLSPLWEFLLTFFGPFGMVIAASSPLILIAVIGLIVLGIVNLCKKTANKHVESFMKKALAAEENGEWDKALEARLTYLQKRPLPEEYYQMGEFCTRARENGWVREEQTTTPLYWYEKAAAKGNVNGQFAIASLRHEEYIDDGQMLKAAKTANEIRALAAKGCRPAFEYLRRIERRGEALGGDMDALAYLMGLGHAKSQTRYGIAVLKEDPAQAMPWLLVAAEGGDVDAQEMCATIYAEGYEGIEKNVERSLYWYEKAAAQGNLDAAFEAGKMYMFGTAHCGRSDFKQALFWLEKAAVNNDPQVDIHIATAYGKLAEKYAVEHGTEFKYHAEYRRYIGLYQEWYDRAIEHGFEPPSEAEGE